MTTTTTPVKGGAAMTAEREFEREPVMLQKRIGSTLFEVTIRFSATSKETMQDKILRLVEREVQND
jgi:hypothetical protein